MMSDEPVNVGDWIYDGLMVQKYNGKDLVWPYDFPIKVYATTNPTSPVLTALYCTVSPVLAQAAWMGPGRTFAPFLAT